MSNALSRAFPGLALTCALLGAGCSHSIDRVPREVDCSLGDGYEFNVLQSFETEQMWYGYGDSTEGGLWTVALETLEPPRCGSTRALGLTSSNFDDWGAGFGEYGLAMTAPDGSAYLGISFWARSEGATSKSFIFNVQDRYVNVAGMLCVDAQALVAAGDPSYTTNEGGQQVPVGQELAGPTDCGNNFQRIVSVSNDWQLYRLPFSTFTQDDLPNRRPEGMDPSAIFQVGLTIPKESVIDLQIDDIAFYRPVAPSAP